jgi:Phosphotransferase system cellobiose-specific component IIB
MLKITMICMGGISTKLMANKVEAAAKKIGDDIKISTTGILENYMELSDCDAVILAPQVRYAESEIREKFENIPLIVIEPVEYGTQNGASVYDRLKKVLK